MRLKIRGPETEVLVWGIVNSGGEVNIIDLSAEVGLTCTKEETAGHPVNVRVLQEVGSRGPLSSPATEPDHLLTASEVVDDSSGGIGGENAAGPVLGDLPGGGAVDDLGWVVEHVLGAHGGISLDVGSLEASAVGNADQLFDVCATASDACVGRRGSKRGLRVGIDANETNTEGTLVGVDGVVLVSANTTVPDATVVLEGKLAERDDTTIFTRRGRGVQSRELEASLRNVGNLVRDAIALQTRDDRVGTIALPDKDQDRRVNGRGHSGSHRGAG